MGATHEWRFVTSDEILHRPDAASLVEGLLNQGRCVFLSGKPKTGKSLFALQLGAAIASGQPFFGRAVARGPVLYVAVERSYLLKPRLATLEHLGIDTSGLVFLEEAIPFDDGDTVEELLRFIGDGIAPLPKLVVVDTLARCFGGNENDAGDMTRFAKGVEHIRDQTGATVLVIHHNTKETTQNNRQVGGRTYRGSSALEGAFDAHLSVAQDAKGLHFTIRSDNEGHDFELRLKPREFDLGMPGCVALEAVGDPDDARTLDSSQRPDDCMVWLQVLKEHGELSDGDWRQAVRERRGKLSNGTHLRVKAELGDAIVAVPGPRNSKRYRPAA